MKDYNTLSNEYFEILIPEKMKDYGKEVLEFSTIKIKEYLEFFHEKEYGSKIKGAFMLNHDDFIKRIKEVSDGSHLPPSWATGCFYGGETQILLNENNPYDRFNTLAHETFHLLFQKFVYDKNKWSRVTWLDESLAGNFDATIDKMLETNKFKDLIIKIDKNNKIPKMDELAFQKGNIVTKNYNGYDLFKIVGRYLIETKSKEELLLYINDLEAIKKDGKTILLSSLKYFKEKYNIC